MESRKNNRGTIVFDFDGVIHNYRNKWKSPTIIDDTPVEGIKEAIDDLRSLGYKITIVSVRCAYKGGREAILEWLIKNDIRVDDITALKPPALVYIDDRALCFDGHAETLIDKIQNFIPWNKDNKQY